MKNPVMYSIEDEQLGQLMGIMFAVMAVIIGVVVAFGIVCWVLTVGYLGA